MAVEHAADDWIEIDEHYVGELDERHRLLHANRDRVVGCIPEVSQRVLNHHACESLAAAKATFHVLACHAWWSMLLQDISWLDHNSCLEARFVRHVRLTGISFIPVRERGALTRVTDF